MYLIIFVGEPDRIRMAHEDGSFSHWGRSERSLPNLWDPNKPLYGVEIDAEGPSHLEDVRFLNYMTTSTRVAAAIFWHEEYMFHNGATTSAR